jgi:glycerol-3-phosphate dehydrogenase
MAETIVNLIAEKFDSEEGRKFKGCQTRKLPISGGDVGGSKKYVQFVQETAEQGTKAGLSKEDATHLASFYGSNAPVVFDLLDKEEAEKYEMPFVVFAKLVYAIEHELAVTPVDFYFRRTGSLLFDIDTVRNTKNQVLRYMEERFGWSTSEKERFNADLNAEIKNATGNES